MKTWNNTHLWPTSQLWRHDGMCLLIFWTQWLTDSNSNCNECVGWARRICTFVVLHTKNNYSFDHKSACVLGNCCGQDWQTFQTTLTTNFMCTCDSCFGQIWQLMWTSLTIVSDKFDNCFRQVWQWFFVHVCLTIKICVIQFCPLWNSILSTLF